MYFFPVLTMTIRNAFPRQTICRHRSTLMDHDIGPEAVHDVDVGEVSTIMDMRIPKVLSTRRKAERMFSNLDDLNEGQ
jgi:hypothetical protein